MAFRATCIFVFAGVASSRRTVTQRLYANENEELSANMTETLLTADAVEMCGVPSAKTLAHLDEPCNNNNKRGGEPEALRVITPLIGQNDGPYRHPPNRLYVCNPDSKLRGVMYKEGKKPVKIKTNKALAKVAADLFGNRLYALEEKYPKDTITRSNGNTERANGKSVDPWHLWCLDMHGNFVIGPEVQNGIIYKHGDLTPGNKPWERPTKGMKKQGESHTSGQYRGLGRAGGELQFRKGQPPLLQDESSYAGFRVLPETINKNSNKPTHEKVTSGRASPTLGTCAMRRLKEYLLGPVKFPLGKTQVAAVYYDPKKRFEQV